MENKYYSEAAMAIHESAKNLFIVGGITEAEMEDFDRRCLVQEPETTAPVKTEQLSHATA